MDYVNLGRTGLKVSRLCMGCMSFCDPKRRFHPWILDEAASRPIFRRAVEAGINFFDTINIYASGTSVIPWSPRARACPTRPWGTVTDRSQTDKTGANFYTDTDEPDSRVVAVVQRLAADKGAAMAQPALAWLLAQPGVTAPIVGVSQMRHLGDALAALDVSLSADDLVALEAPYAPHSVSGHA